MDGVDEALQRAASEEGVAAAWLRGLACNPGLPAPVLQRLLEFGELPMSPVRWRELDAGSTAVAAAAARMEHRLHVAENPTADVDELARLAHDAEPRVRFVYAALLTDFGRRVPAGVVEVLAADPDPKVRRMISSYRDLPLTLEDRFLADEDPGVRAAVLRPQLWERLPRPVRERLLGDPAPQVREKIAALLRADDPPPALTAEERLTHPDGYVRKEAVGDPEVPPALALRLVEDPENEVRLALSMREDLTEEQRASIAYTVEGHGPWPSWVEERAKDPAAARRIAASPHVGLRRALACRPHLPADVVTQLAADEDPWVRRYLCEHSPDAPHDLLVELYATAQDRNWSALRHHPNFPRPGLARFADDPNPRLRHAALDDPAAGPELPLRLADDPEVGMWAVRDPRLPAGELLRRLALPGGAFAAAANPALPPERMHRLVDLARGR
ncbi:hypothetical protein AB0D08_14600 [Kitasatospora sp. NPDC048540]|uniref:hypothetical protein n=1 Tax=Kitasatospora sp. NPDC048540 TaxID=3155634 RepID=UPI0033F1A6B5